MTHILGVQFIEDGKNIALISSSWLTPRKTEAYWPPYKSQYRYEQSLKKGEIPTDEWCLYKIDILFNSKDNDLQKAKKHLKFCEENSDVPSDFDTALEKLNPINAQRTKKLPSRFCHTESSENEDNEKLMTRKKKKAHKSILLERPPLISDDESEKENASTNVTTNNILQAQQVQNSASTSNSTSNIVTTTIANTSWKKQQSSNLFDESFQKQLLTLLVEIKEQNTQILALLREKELNKVPGILPVDIPVKFPLDTEEHLELLENYLKEDEKLNSLTLYLASIGGKNVTTLTNRIMKFLYTDDLAKKFSFFGKRDNKKPFSECLLKTAVINAVKTCHLDATNRSVEDILKVWLKHAPQRSKQTKINL